MPSRDHDRIIKFVKRGLNPREIMRLFGIGKAELVAILVEEAQRRAKPSLEKP